MRTEVDDNALKQLQTEHGNLIKEYQGIIKDKITIFDQMIKNLRSLSDGNNTAITNEEEIAQQKIDIEVWERDITQQTRVLMDLEVSKEFTQGQIDKQNRILLGKEEQISQLQQELEDAEIELQEFKETDADMDQQIINLRQQIEDAEAERLRRIQEEEERRR